MQGDLDFKFFFLLTFGETEWGDPQGELLLCEHTLEAMLLSLDHLSYGRGEATSSE